MGLGQSGMGKVGGVVERERSIVCVCLGERIVKSR